MVLSFPASGLDVDTDQTLRIARLSSADRSRETPGTIRHETQKLAQGRFLVATNRIKDRIFGRSVILLVAHERSGSMGLMINKETESTIADLLPDVRELAGKPDRLYFGGPVSLGEVFLLVRMNEKPEESVKVVGNIYMSKSMALLKRLADGRKQGDKFRFYAGYAGWGAGQLEAEIIRGDWFVIEANPDIVFEQDPSALWDRLMPKTISI